MDLIDRGSVVSYVGVPMLLGTTGAIGAGALDTFFVTGSATNLASSRPISLACASGVSREIRSASFGFVPKWYANSGPMSDDWIV